MTPTSDHAVEGRDSGRLVVLLGALTTFGPLSIDTYLPALPALRRDFGAGASQAQLTLSACLIGLALGQLLAGPLSDALGRRRPLLVGLAAYALASLLCAAAPTIGVLMGLRFVQGCAGAAGIVISRAVVRDMHAGTAAARYFSRLMLVNGLAPILAPILGGQLLRFMTWHGVFVVLAILGSALFLAAWFGLPETMPPANRQTGGFAATFQAFRELLADRAFTGYALSAGFAFAVLFSYIAGSSFVLQEIYGVSPQTFSLLFGMNALGILAASQINRRFIGRVPLPRLLAIGLGMNALGSGAFLLVVLGGAGLAAVLPALFVAISSIGVISPNAAALALSGHPRTAGSASAVLGVLQYAIGAAAAPLVGLGGSGTAVPMAVVMATMGGCALVASFVLTRGRV